MLSFFRNIILFILFTNIFFGMVLLSSCSPASEGVQNTNQLEVNESEYTMIETQMLIRKPVNEVFQAFIDPAITTNFWFTKSSGKLVKGQKVKWEWEMYNASTDLEVKDIVNNELISIEWGDPSTTVDFEFTRVSGNSTYVIIKNYGFNLTGEELIATIKDGTAGFTTVLDGLKAYLEHGIKLNLIGDKFLMK